MHALGPVTRGQCCQAVAKLLGCNVYYAFELALLITCCPPPLLLNSLYVAACNNAEQVAMTASFCDSSLTRRSTLACFNQTVHRRKGLAGVGMAVCIATCLSWLSHCGVSGVTPPAG